MASTHPYNQIVLFGVSLMYIMRKRGPGCRDSRSFFVNFFFIGFYYPGKIEPPNDDFFILTVNSSALILN